MKRIGNAAKKLAVDREVRTQRKRSEELAVDWELVGPVAFLLLDGESDGGSDQVDKLASFLSTAFLGAMSSAKLINCLLYTSPSPRDRG